MKKLIFASLLFLLFLCSDAYAQKYFSGTIEYTTEFDIRNENIPEEALRNYIGTGSTFQYANGKYYQQFHSGQLEFEFADSETNTVYRKKFGNDTIFIKDVSLPDETVIKDYSHSDSSLKVLDYECSIFEIQAKTPSLNMTNFMKFWYAEKIKIDGTLFSNFKSAFANVVYGQMNSIPLKFEVGDADFSIITTATSLKRERLNLEKTFKQLMKDKPTSHKEVY